MYYGKDLDAVERKLKAIGIHSLAAFAKDRFYYHIWYYYYYYYYYCYCYYYYYYYYYNCYCYY